jgi:PilZ domain
MQERRTALPRKRMLKAGKIVFNRGGSGIDATVKNLSATGAMLQVANVVGIPDEFTLVIEADNFKRTCAVVWRQSARLGVRFV